MHGRTAPRCRSGGTGAAGEQGRPGDGPLRERQAVRRVLVHERSAFTGLPDGDDGTEQGAAGRGNDSDSTRSKVGCPAMPRGRVISAVAFRATGVRRRGGKSPAGREVSGMGREPVFHRRLEESSDFERPADAPLRPDSGTRRRQALLGGRGRGTEAAPSRPVLALHAPRTRTDCRALPTSPAAARAPGAGAAAGGGPARSRRGGGTARA